MKNKWGIVTVALFLCVASIELVWSATPPSSDADDCSHANRPIGYISDIKFPGGGREIKVYDVDSNEQPGHKPVCLSKKANDTIFWTRRNGKKFKMKISPAAADMAKCSQHPFV